MTADDQRELLASLIGEIDGFNRGFPAGYLARQVRERDVEEAGLTFREDDAGFGHIYVGLAVLARDAHQYLTEPVEPIDEPAAALFGDVVDRVHRAEAARWGPKAFPSYKGLPVELVAALPTGMAAAAAQGRPDVTPLGSTEIIHEWTFKPGKRLFHALVERLGTPCQGLLCGDLRKRLERGKLQDQALGVALGVVATGLGVSSLWLPVAAYVGLGVATKGLTRYCDLESEKSELVIPSSW